MIGWSTAVSQDRARLQGRGARRLDASVSTNVIAVGLLFIAPGEAARSQQSFSELARSAGTPQVPGLTMVYLSPLGDPRSAPWKNIIVHQTEGPPGSAHRVAKRQAADPKGALDEARASTTADQGNARNRGDAARRWRQPERQQVHQ